MLRAPGLIFAILILLACNAGPSTSEFSESQAQSGPESSDLVTSPISSTEEEVENRLANIGEEFSANPELQSAVLSGPEDHLSDEKSGERFTRPPAVKGLYVNAWAAGSRTRMDALVDVAQRTEVNAFVIDIKDASGYVSHSTEVEFAHEVSATEEIRIRDLSGLLMRLEQEQIYPIARIVIVKDPIVAVSRPDLAVQDSAGGVWIDSKGIVWLNPYKREVWDYHVDLAREVAQMGFPEIQWDYVRFPDAPEQERERAVYPGADGLSKTEAIRNFLSYSRAELASVGARVTADVFGLTTSASRDVGIGQLWESFIDVVDAALPMVYPSHYWSGSFGIDTPNAYPYEIVNSALGDALRRSAQVDGAASTIPWLQDFTLGDPPYGSPEVRAQIQAAHDAGINEWVLWNPGSRYTETALEPIGGFREEPLVRVGNTLIPVSRRWELIDTTTVLPDTLDGR